MAKTAADVLLNRTRRRTLSPLGGTAAATIVLLVVSQFPNFQVTPFSAEAIVGAVLLACWAAECRVVSVFYRHIEYTDISSQEWVDSTLWGGVKKLVPTLLGLYACSLLIRQDAATLLWFPDMIVAALAIFFWVHGQAWTGLYALAVAIGWGFFPNLPLLVVAPLLFEWARRSLVRSLSQEPRPTRPLGWQTHVPATVAMVALLCRPVEPILWLYTLVACWNSFWMAWNAVRKERTTGTGVLLQLTRRTVPEYLRGLKGSNVVACVAVHALGAVLMPQQVWMITGYALTSVCLIRLSTALGAGVEGTQPSWLGGLTGAMFGALTYVGVACVPLCLAIIVSGEAGAVVTLVLITPIFGRMVWDWAQGGLMDDAGFLSLS